MSVMLCGCLWTLIPCPECQAQGYYRLEAEQLVPVGTCLDLHPSCAQAVRSQGREFVAKNQIRLLPQAQLCKQSQVYALWGVRRLAAVCRPQPISVGELQLCVETKFISLQYRWSERGHSPQPISIAKGLQASAYMLLQSSGGTGFCNVAKSCCVSAVLPQGWFAKKCPTCRVGVKGLTCCRTRTDGDCNKVNTDTVLPLLHVLTFFIQPLLVCTDLSMQAREVYSWPGRSLLPLESRLTLWCFR